ncbi:MAG: glycosyltransferase [Bacteroidetes bacterium]|nr:glycosyltransferase [Bacteroidota bacterium]
MLTILFVIPGSPEGNSMIFSKRQARQLEEAGHKVVVFYLQERGGIMDLVRQTKLVKAQIKQHNPDVVHAHYGTFTAMVVALCRFKRTIITYQGSDLNMLRSEPWLKEVVAKLFSQLASIQAYKVICVSKKLRQKLIFARSKCSIIPMGVDLEQYYPIPMQEARNQLRWTIDAKIILFNYNNAAVKRIDIAQQATALVQQQMPDLQLHVLDGKVEYEKLLLMYNASNCLLMCSDSEGSPTMIKEAMACNLPVVSSDAGDIFENIKATNPVAMCKQQAEDIASGIIQVVNKNQRSNGREVVTSLQLDSHTLLQKLIYLYQS